MHCRGGGLHLARQLAPVVVKPPPKSALFIGIVACLAVMAWGGLFGSFGLGPRHCVLCSESN
jgi:hypothetical protein